jgi:hypothetical protein
VGEQEWLEQGHGGGEGLQPMIKGSSGGAGERASIRNALRGTDSAAPRRGARRRNKALVGWLLYCCTAAGGTAAAWTVRETLFPALGAPTERSVWKNSNSDTTVTTKPESGSTEADEIKVISADVAGSTVSIAGSPNEGSGAPSTTQAVGGPSNSVDNRGTNGGNAPQTGTTVVDGQSGTPGGPVATPAANPSGPGGPVTSVDNHGNGTNTSTPASVSNPPASVDPPVTAASLPGSVTTDVSGGGSSGGGGGGGGGGSPGGPPTTVAP